MQELESRPNRRPFLGGPLKPLSHLGSGVLKCFGFCTRGADGRSEESGLLWVRSCAGRVRTLSRADASGGRNGTPMQPLWAGHGIGACSEEPPIGQDETPPPGRCGPQPDQSKACDAELLRLPWGVQRPSALPPQVAWTSISRTSPTIACALVPRRGWPSHIGRVTFCVFQESRPPRRTSLIPSWRQASHCGGGGAT